MSDPYDRLRADVVEYVEVELESIREDARGDSPIEKLFFTALQAVVHFGMCEYKHVEAPSSPDALARALSGENPLTLIVVPQAQLDGWRVDFLVYAWDFGRVTGRPQWRRLIVECDGHDFHERTKEQAARDRSRDREFQILGFSVLRFTGSEIHKDPRRCAQQVAEWGVMGW